jgi:hypothetical protein
MSEIPQETARAMLAALKALTNAYPENDEDNSVENLWARYGSEFACAVRDARAAVALAEARA